MNTHQKDIFN